MKRKVFVIAIVLISVVGVGAFYRIRQPEKPQFQTAAVSRGSIIDAVEATGTLEPVDPVQIGSQVTGTVASLGTDFNQLVKKGQIVATLDPALYQAQVDQAQATVMRLMADLERAKVQVTDAKIKLARAQALSKEKLIADQDLDAAAILADANQAALKSAEAQLVQAQASLAQARVNLDHTIIRAPDDGIVLSRSVEIGQTVSASLQAPTLFIIARDLSTMRVNASIDESDIGRVKEGQIVHFTVDAYGTDQFEGKVTEVRLQPTVTQGVVSYPTVIEVPNPDLRLKPGMTATVSVELARADDVLRIPLSALRFRPTPEQRGEKPGEMTSRESGGGGDRASRDGGDGGANAGGAAANAGANAGTNGQGTNGQGTNGQGTSGQGTNGQAANVQGTNGQGTNGQATNAQGTSGQGGPAASRQQGSGGPGAGGGANGGGWRGRGGAEGAGAGAGGGQRRGGGDFAARPIAPGQTRMVWRLVNNQLKPVRVRIGLANATHAALIEGDLEDGAEVVTGVAQPTNLTQTGTSSPLMPNMPRRGPGGGGGGGGQGGGPRRSN